MVNEVDLNLFYKQRKGDVLITDLRGVIDESIANILNTRIGNRLFNRGFGSTVTDLLFEPMTPFVGKFLLIEIEKVLDRFEPRVELIFSQSEVRADYDNNGYDIRIVYRILQTNDVSEFNTFLDRLTR
jgi:phage baseplate assembly protein W